MYLLCEHERGIVMETKSKYFVVKQKAVPEVLLKVVEAKKLLESERVITVQEATEAVGISRSSFYKYKDDIFPFYDNAKGKTVTFVTQMDDEPGLLSDLLHIVAVYKANILTIHQSIPVNGVATLTLSVEVLSDTGDVSNMVEEIEMMKGSARNPFTGTVYSRSDRKAITCSMKTPWRIPSVSPHPTSLPPSS